MPILGVVASSYRSGVVDTGAMFPLQVITVGPAGASSVSFTNIPNTYTHLQLRFSVGNTVDAFFIDMRFNNDTGSNYDNHRLRGDGSTATSGADINVSSIHLSRLGPLVSGTQFYNGGVTDILDYANTNKYKTIRTLGGYDRNGTGSVDLQSGLWRNTNAITSMQFTSFSGNFAANSQFALYGIKAA